jgi:hypothetical protein
MKIVIKVATWGNGAVVTDITSTIQKKADAGYININVSPEIAGITLYKKAEVKPQDNVNYEITGDESEKIRTDAATKCPDGNRNCIDTEVAKLQQELIQQKIKQSKDQGNNPLDNGDRLTVTYSIDGGPDTTVVFKTGETFQINAPADVSPTEAKAVESTWEKWVEYFAAWAWWSLKWIVHLALAYGAYLQLQHVDAYLPPQIASMIPHNFKQDAIKYISYAGLGLSILIPYFGFFIIGGFLIADKWMKAKNGVGSVIRR